MWLEFLFIIYMLSLLNSENGKLNKKTKFILSVGHSNKVYVEEEYDFQSLIINNSWNGTIFSYGK